MYGVFVSQGGYSRFHVTGMIEWGQKSKPKKIPRGSNEPKKFPGPKINPPKKSHAEFPSLKNFQQGLSHKSRAKDIKNSLQQKGIPVTINAMDEKSVEWIEALLDTLRDTLWSIV